MYYEPCIILSRPCPRRTAPHDRVLFAYSKVASLICPNAFKFVRPCVESYALFPGIFLKPKLISVDSQTPRGPPGGGVHVFSQSTKSQKFSPRRAKNKNGFKNIYSSLYSHFFSSAALSLFLKRSKIMSMFLFFACGAFSFIYP